MAEFKLGRIRFVWKNNWATGTTYYKDDVVALGGKIYICVIGHTAAPDFFTDLNVVPTRWNLVSDGQTWKGDWEPQVSYILNDIVRYGGRLYICQENHTSASDSGSGLEADLDKWQIYVEGLDWKGEWSENFDYKIKDIVKYGGYTYVCNEEHISAATDALGLEADQSKWDILNKGFEYKSDWTATTRYKLNDVVRRGSGLYISLAGHTSTSEFGNDIANWEKFVDGLQFEAEWLYTKNYQPGDIVRYGGNYYVSKTDHSDSIPPTEINDWDLLATGFNFLSDWGDDSSNYEYKVGDVVSLGGYTYRCIQDHQGQQPPNPTYWDRISTGLNWRGSWTDDAEYVLGDVVKYGANSYICVQGHISEGDDYSSLSTGAENSRPDQDITGTYWNILSIGSETSVLTTTGDMVYYGGAGPTRLPIGQNGQLLQVSTAGVPEWAFSGTVEDVYYVAESGVDSPAPIYGKSLDRPWRSINYAARQVEKGAKNPATARLLELNRKFIQREIVEWLDYQITNAEVGSIFENLVYDGIKCERDMGFIVDALIWDVTHGGNVRSREAALSYVNDTVGSPYLTQKEQTVAAINYGLTVIERVLLQQDPTVNYQVLNGDNSTAVVTQWKDEDIEAESVFPRITDLAKIITDAITAGNANNIPARLINTVLIKVSTGTYYENLPIIVPAETCIMGDELRATNVIARKASNSTLTPKSDFKYSFKALERIEVIVDDIVTGAAVTPTTGNTVSQTQEWPYAQTPWVAPAVTKLARTIRREIDYKLGTKQEANLPPAHEVSDLGFARLRDLMLLNKDFIQKEIVAYLSSVYPNINYSRTKCKQDVGYILDAIAYDLSFGGNWQSTNAGLAYFNGASGTLQIDSTEKTATLAAYEYLKDLVETVGRNIIVNPTYQQDPTQIPGVAGSNPAATRINELIDDIKDIINTGPGAASITYPTISDADANTIKSALEAVEATVISNTTTFITTNFPSLVYDTAKCERDIGLILDAAIYDFALGTDFASIVAAQSYLRAPSTNVLLDQKAASLAGFEYARQQFRAAVPVGAQYDFGRTGIDTAWQWIDDTVFYGNAEGGNNHVDDQEVYNAVRQLELNKEFIVAEALAYVDNYFKDTVTNINTTTNVFTISSTGWMEQGMPIKFVAGDDSSNSVTTTGLTEAATYYVRDVLSATQFTISNALGGSEFDITEYGEGFTVQKAYEYNRTLCARDVREYIDAIKWDMIWPQQWKREYTNSVTLWYPAAYKTKLAARYYANSVLGCQEEDFYYLRNNTGLRLQTLDGLQGDLSPANEYGTQRPTAGAYASLDPGWGPNDRRVWITARSPYIQNCTTFGYAAVGQKVDGNLHAGGNDSLTSNDFTQLISDGIGAWITNNGRAELVSVFTYYSLIGYLAENGGRIRATNGNNSYGTFGSVAEGVDAEEIPVTAIVDNRKQYKATISNVFTDQDQLLQLEYAHAGNDYTEAQIDIFGGGRDEDLIADEFRDNAVNRVRIDEINDSSGLAGGSGYTLVSNVAQTGDSTSIRLAATDGNLSNDYPSMAVYVVGGAGAGLYGIINNYNAGSKQADVVREATREVTSAGSFVTNEVYKIVSLGNTNWNAIALNQNGRARPGTTPAIGDIFTATGAGSGSGTAVLMEAGWDHVLPGYPLETPNASSTYQIEPRIHIDLPTNTASASTLGSGAYASVHYIETSNLYSDVATTTSGSGVDATFNVRRNGSKYYIELSSAGTGYERLDTLTVAGTSLGGASPLNDITITATTINSTTGAILNFDFDGYGQKGIFLALPSSGTTGQKSINGTTWSSETLPNPGSGAWSNLASGLLDDGSSLEKPTAVVIVADGGSTVAYSTDADTWSTSTLPIAFNSASVTDVAYGSVDPLTLDNRFVVISEADRDVCYTLNAGATWTLVADALPSVGFTAITHGIKKFVAVKANSTEAAYSIDGESWTATVLPSSSNWIDVIWGNGRFLAISSTTAGAYSLDGITWYETTLPGAGVTYRKVAYGAGVFVATRNNGSIAYSEDGIVWGDDLALSGASAFRAVGFGNPDRTGKFVAIADGTTTVVNDVRIGARAKGRASVSNEQIFEVRLSEPGSGYTGAPEVTVFDPKNINDVVLQARLGDGTLGQPSFANRGFGFTTSSAEINSENSNGNANFLQSGSFIAVRQLSRIPVEGSNVEFASIPGKFYKLVANISLIGTEDGSRTVFLQISPPVDIADSPLDGDPVEMRIRFSQVRLTGHDFLDIGTGGFVTTNYPNPPLQQPDQSKETRASNGGRVFFTATDQDGNFRVGDLFSIEQATGVATLNAEAFNIAGLQELTLGEVTLGGNSASITEFSTDPFFTANSDSVVPTQRAIKAYIEAQIGGGGATLIVNSVTAGDIFVGTDTIRSVSGETINITGNVNFTGSVLGLPLAYNYFLR